jgi:predicted unusual protein kinase regulating ubiquinone biosynthesis (AarF/ABC1/UbiB family)
MKVLVQLLQAVVLSVVFASSVFAGQRLEKPIFLSYEQRLIFSYLLAGANEPQEKQFEISRRLEQTLRRWIQLPTQEIEVGTFAAFLKAYQGPWPQSYSLESDLGLIEKSELRGPVIIKASTAELQKQIDGFMLRQNFNLLQKTKPPELPDPRVWLRLKNKNQWVVQGFNEVSSLLNANLKLIQQTGAEMALSGKMTGTDEAMNLFMTTAFREYFGRLSLATKKQIISQIMWQNLNMNLQQRFEQMILASGPQFQKLLQVVAREAGVSEDLLKIFKQLESKASPIPAPIVKELFESERDRYHWISYELQPLGTGTMAQVHRGKIELNGREQDVVIRFLKPEIEKRVSEDHRILLELAPIMDSDPRFRQAGFPKLLPVVTDLNRTVMDELDLPATIERQRQAKKIYDRQVMFVGSTYKNVIDINVPDVYLSDPSSKLQVQELVVGEKLDKVAALYQDSIPDLKKGIAEQMARMWVEEVLYGSGFFHSDLHQGNFLVDFTDQKINISVLDFGMGGTISHAMQTQMMEVGAGIDLDRADLIADGFWSLSHQAQNSIGKDEFLKQVSVRIDNIKSGKTTWEPVNRWTSWAMDQGLRFPYEFVSLNRGLVILDKLLKDSGSPLTMSELARKTATKHIAKAIADLRATKMMSWTDFIKLGLVSRPPESLKPSENAALPGMNRSSLECRRVFLQDRTSFLGLGAEGLLTWTEGAF